MKLLVTAVFSIFSVELVQNVQITELIQLQCYMLFSESISMKFFSVVHPVLHLRDKRGCCEHQRAVVTNFCFLAPLCPMGNLSYQVNDYLASS